MKRSIGIAQAAFIGLAMAGGSARGQVTRNQAVQILYTFYQIAANGALSQPTLVTVQSPPYQDLVSAGDPVPGFWYLQFGNGHCDISQTDGKIEYFVLHPDSHPELSATYPSLPVLPLPQIATLANGYLTAAGWPDTYTVYQVTQQFPDDLLYAKYALEIHAMRGAAMVLDPIQVEMEPTTGFLERLNILGDPPSTPPNMTPAVTPNQAMSVISSYALSAHGISALLNIRPLILGLWRPVANPNNPDCFVTPAEAQMGQNNEGMLVYYGYFGDQATYDPSEGLSYNRFYAYVDAQTGLLLDMDYSSGFGLKATVGPRRAHGPLSWDWEPGPTTVIAGKLSALAAGGDVLSASGTAKPTVGTPIVIRRGRLTVACRFDRASGLVWMTQGKRRVYGRPNKELLRAIVQVTKTSKPSTLMKR